MKKINIREVCNNHIALTAWRLILLYITLSITRFIFLIYNHDTVGAISLGELGALIKGSLTFDSVSIIYSSSLWLLLSLLPFTFRVSRWYQRALFGLYMTTTSTLLIALNICDAVYFHYAQKRFTASEMLFSDNGNNATIALQAAAENWYMIPLAILIIFVVAKAYMPNAKVEDINHRAIIFYPVNTLIILLAVTLSIGGVRGGLSHDIRPLTLSNVMQFTTDSEKSYMILSNPFCVIRTIGKSEIRVPKYFDKKVADALFTPYHYPDKSAESPYNGYNVVLFILESFSAENSAHLSPDLYKEGELGYMPFLDTLMRNGVTLKQMYANGARSISGTPAILGSIPSFETPFVLMSQSIAPSRQLPAMLRDMGYATLFACGSSRTSMGFAAYAQSAGVDRYISREDYEKVYGMGSSNLWGIWDEEFIDYFGEIISQSPEPHFSSLFTISSHHPFDVPERYEATLPKGTTAIHQCTAYTDMALQKFFEKYKNQEWFSRTIFVFVADHVSSEKMAERTHKYPGNHHIVGAIYTPDQSLQAEIEKVCSQVDLMPTILSLVGNKKPFFAFGRDIMNEDENRPMWSVCHAGGIKAYDSSGQILTPQNSDTLKAFEQQYFDHIARRDYLVK